MGSRSPLVLAKKKKKKKKDKPSVLRLRGPTRVSSKREQTNTEPSVLGEDRGHGR